MAEITIGPPTAGMGDNARGCSHTVVKWTTIMARDFESDDEGKRVVTSDGDEVGTIERASGSTAHVKPVDDLSRSIRRRLGWSEEGEETYRLETSKVDRITDDEVRLMADL